MLTSNGKLAALLLDFREEARVLDRDHRLRREGFQELGGGGRKLAGCAAAHDQCADDAVRPQERNHEERAETGLEDDIRDGIGGFRREIRPLYWSALCRRLADAGGPEPDLLLTDRLHQRRVHAVGGPQPEKRSVLIIDVDRACLRLRQAYRVGYDGREHSLKIER